MKSYIFLLTLLITSPAFAAGFTDKDDFPLWAETAIELVNEEGLMTGYGDGSFGVDQSLTRAEVVTLISRVKKASNIESNSEVRFPDVIRGAWYEAAIDLAAQEGWVKGHDDGNFYPGNSLTRAEFAALLQRAFNLETDNPAASLKFEDVRASYWYAASVSALLEHDLLRTSMNANFAPGTEVTRAEAAWTFAQLINKPGLTTASVDFENEGLDPLDSRRVAVKPRDFRANKQGYDIARAAINVSAEPASEEIIAFDLSSDWQPLGEVLITNSFDYRADLDSLRVRLRLDADDMGPEEGFFLKFEGPDILIEEKVYSNGELALTGLNYAFDPEAELVLKVFIKPDTQESFYSRIATGKVFVIDATGQAYKDMISESRDSNVRVAPIEYGTRDLASFEFTPVVSE